ncbi:MAG: hypothetical protein LBI60_04740 [Bacteroidales bacterium]|jgi:hypothetical protein|nr:hypothetical protein [Bacteroidales bacterium]
MNYKGYTITFTEDCGENKGGHYCEVYSDQECDNQAGYFCIHPDEFTTEDEIERLARQYIDKEFSNHITYKVYENEIKAIYNPIMQEIEILSKTKILLKTILEPGATDSDYWDAIEVDGNIFDINLTKDDDEYKYSLAVYPVEDNNRLDDIFTSVPLTITFDFRQNISFDRLKEMWMEFGDIPIDDDECIESDFYHWPVGTDRYEIWHWFDDRCPNNLHDDLMHPDE